MSVGFLDYINKCIANVKLLKLATVKFCFIIEIKYLEKRARNFIVSYLIFLLLTYAQINTKINKIFAK